MAMLFLRVFFVCAVILSVCPAKTKTQVANINSVSGVKNIADSHNVTDPEDVVVLKGQPATLSCNIRPPGGDGSRLTTTWLHQNQPIPEDDSRRKVQKDGSLHIARVTGGRRPLTGSYRCRVRNDVGAVLSGEAKVQIASLDFNVTNYLIEIPEQQPVLLPCQAHSVPQAKLRWEFNKRPLPHNSRYVPLPSGALLILKTQQSDNGVFKCTVTNPVMKKSKYKDVTLVVVPRFEEKKPVSFLPLPDSLNTTVTVGQRSSLYCVAQGWPLPSVQWLRDGKIVSNQSVLSIMPDSQHEEITYECRARNEVNEASQIHKVMVQRKPYFTKTPTSLSYVTAGVVKLACAAGGIPTPCIQWLKDGEKVELGARIKISNGTLVMRHTFTNDAGIYQCIASNSAGTIWAPAQLVADENTPTTPPPPQNAQCRSYDSKSVCISWKEPEIRGGDSILAYSIFSFYKTSQCLSEKCQGTNNTIGCEDGSHEEPGLDYVITNGTYFLADRLNSSTNYTFYVRMYTRGASDDSNWVTCETVVKGERNLRFRLLDRGAIELVWSEISSDIACGSTNTSYVVQWKNEVDLDHKVNSEQTETLKYNLTGLNPEVNYHIRVMSSSYLNGDTNWVLLKLPEMDTEEMASNQTYISFDKKTIAQNVPTNPEGFRATNIHSKSVTLNWVASDREAVSYAICYAELGTEDCETGNIVKSSSNLKHIEDLKPNTMYEFRIRSHNAEGFHGPFSAPIQVKTHPDVPSTVLDLKYEIINDSTACLAWLPPLYTHGRLVNYIVTYTSNANRPLEEWTYVTVPANRASDSACWLDKKKSTISVMLKDLELTEAYTVIVRAASDNGLSNPTFPIVLRTAYSMKTGRQEVISGKQKMGVVVGCILALICIACCVSCIVMRRRCVKRRNLAHARLAASNNYYPASAHYATQGSTVQVRLENACLAADARAETESLVVDDDDAGNDASPQPVYLDPKEKDEIPNGKVNGLDKPLMNGHLSNGLVHITENPQIHKHNLLNDHPPFQFEKKEKNGEVPRTNGFRRTPQYTLFQDDANSNRMIAAPKHNPYIDLSPKRRGKCNGLLKGGVEEITPYSGKGIDLETTQIGSGLFDDPFIIGQHRKISPLLGPNV
ncbi:immunoglobulin superfamily DCC subclass member 4-like isoform X2 [Harmonia axyridis]|uniref:immunoglobulin superfamily DCC subclass member 4-like isoform X2 n=1 Tax=Harmonia axyridis TaxID=115357 RepID=UPI001E278096|nr:immunoglobulin superfamily DCC subclass member 4-like isoform X2 [Harmonia axyridis]